MNSSKRKLSFIIILSLIVVSILSGCIQTTEENAQPKEDFSIFFGSMDDAIKIDALLTEYEEETGIRINPLITSTESNSTIELKSFLSDTEPPVAYAASYEEDIEWLSEGAFIENFSELDSEIEGNSIPYNLEGYGLAFDRAVLEEIFGKKTAKTLVDALKNTDFSSWSECITALDSFINNRETQGFSIDEVDYSFPNKKGKLASKLNGVFAIAGGDSNMYGFQLINTVLPTIDLNSWIEVKNEELTGAALQVMDPTLTTYVDGLDLMTSYLSGEYSAGIRGSDFVREDYYGADQTKQIFMRGRAIFAVLSVDEYEAVELLNAKKAQTLEYLPIKMPYDESLGGRSSSGAILDRSIPGKISTSFYINANSPKETQQKALDFLNWFVGKDGKMENSLIVSLKEYISQGNYLEYDYSPEELEEWKETVFDKGPVRRLLQKELWTDEEKEELKIQLVELWSKS